MIDITCTCGKKVQLGDEKAGGEFRCEACGKVNAVPTAENAAAIDVTHEFTPAPPKPESKPELKSGQGVSAENPSGEPNQNDYGTHRVLREHARGGMGRVSIARDENLHREVALKELFANGADNDTVVRRFLDEARITARLEHPGIVPVHAFGLDAQGRPFYTMKLIRGKTLQEAIREYHRMADTAPEKTAALRELLRRFASVCQTTQFAHDRGILHRDLKPANIMLGEHGETLVMDWGLAKPLAEPDDATLGDLGSDELSQRPAYTQSGNVIGTPAYMSPEQASGDAAAVGTQSDVYSLGAILYQILTDKTPHTGKSSYEIVQKVLTDAPKPASEMKKSTPRALEAIAMKAISRDPQARYADTAGLYRDVMNWLDDEPLSALPDTRHAQMWRWMRKNRALATTLLTAAFLFILMLSATGILLERARTQTFAAEKVRDEMKLRAESALTQAKLLESDLRTKEDELSQAKAALAASLHGDAAERERLRKRVAELTAEAAALRTKISRLHVLAAELSEDEVPEISLLAPPPPLGDDSLHCVLFDIGEMLNRGQVEVIGFETKERNINEILDINSLQMNRPIISDAINPASVTLVLQFPQKISGLMFSYCASLDGTFQVETADSLDDLQRQKNTYRLLISETPIIATDENMANNNVINFPQPLSLKAIRLTVRRTSYDDLVHLNNLRFWGVPNLDDVPLEGETSATDFEIWIYNDGVRITKYTGAEGRVNIPRMISGKPVVSIGKNAFDRTNARIVSTPDTLVSIDEYAFTGCANLRKIYLSKSVKDINKLAFGSGHPWLVTCETDSENPFFTSVDGVLYTKDMKELRLYPANKPGTHYTTPPGVERIENFAFRDSRHLVSVTVSEGVKHIDWHVFSGAWRLEKINLPESLLTINEGTFAGCGSLKEIRIPDKVSLIGRGMFGGCTSLKTVHLGAAMQHISEIAFENCPSLQEFTVSPENPRWTTVDGILFTKDEKTLYRYPVGRTATTYMIPDGVETIGEFAFLFSKHMKNIQIPDSVHSLNRDAFSTCEALESITIPDSVTYIGGGALRTSKNLKSVTLPANLTNISNGLLGGNPSLHDIRIPEKVELIGDGSFEGCSELTSITIPKSVKQITSHTFRNCQKLADVTILGEPEMGDNIFENCNLAILTIHGKKGSKVEAFAKNKGIKFVELKTAAMK